MFLCVLGVLNVSLCARGIGFSVYRTFPCVRGIEHFSVCYGNERFSVC